MVDSELGNQALELMETGTNHLSSKSYANARRDFSEGLNLVKQILNLQEGEEGEDEDDGIGVDDFEAGHSPEGNCFYFSTLPQQSTSKAKANTDEPFIFRSPLVAPAEEMKEGQPMPTRSYVKFSFALLYNLALTHHLRALDSDSGDFSQKRLKKAIALYELAYQILVTEGIQLSVLQTLALLNNLGHAHALLGSTEQSQQCFQQLLSTIMFANDLGDHDVSLLPLIEGFLENVLPPANVAPAA